GIINTVAFCDDAQTAAFLRRVQQLIDVVKFPVSLLNAAVDRVEGFASNAVVVGAQSLCVSVDTLVNGILNASTNAGNSPLATVKAAEFWSPADQVGEPADLEQAAAEVLTALTAFSSTSDQYVLATTDVVQASQKLDPDAHLVSDTVGMLEAVL